MSSTELVLLAIVTFAAATQRITGIGFALICTPFLVLGIDPLHGVLIANALCVILNIVVLTQTWRSVEIRSILLLTAAALATIPLGQYVAIHISSALLMIIIGSMLLVGLVLLRFRPRLPKFGEIWGALIAGSVSGFMNVTAGVGGPAVALYANAQNWDQKKFVASVQLYFLIVNSASVLAEDPKSLHLSQILMFGTFLLVGSIAGHYSSQVIKAEHARTATLLVACLGAAATVIKGFMLIL